jgi:hypothetical protein
MQTHTTTRTETTMTTRSRDTRTALDAYMEHHQAALALVERIHEALANHDISPDPESVNWGHVGDIASTRRELQDLADRLFNEGEYAEVACLRCPATFATGAELDRHYFTAH